MVGIGAKLIDRPTILHVFSTFAVGGQQVRFASLANHFGPRYRHAVIAMDGNLACRERLDPALDVSFPAVPVRHGRTLGNILPFRRMLATMRPHALFTYNWGSIDWAIANLLSPIGAVVRQVHVEDGFGPEERSVQLPRRVWMRRLVLRGRTVVVPSRTLEAIATRVWRLPRVAYVPNGVDLTRFAAHSRPETEGVPVVGTVAALRAEKNIGRLIRAMAGLPGRLVVVGDGPERPALEALARERGVEATFAGHVPEPSALIAGFDVFALSSDTEQMPISLLEAMAAGRAVASTDVGDVRAMLAAENAPYVVAGDDAALAGALRALLEDAALRARLGAANRARAEAEYDEAAMFARWRSLMDGPPG